MGSVSKAAGTAAAPLWSISAEGVKYLADQTKPPKRKNAPAPPVDEVELETEITQRQRQARDRIRARAASSRQTILTGPSGLQAPATTARKTLLGGSL